MRTFIALSICLLIVAPAALSQAAGPDAAPIGLLSKVILDVSRKEVSKEWQKAKKGETLLSGDRIRTGEKSIAIIKFKDNSLVRVHELSELVVTGNSDGGAFSKSVEMQNGVVGFSVQKQKPNEEFKFTSPTSVASIRGTEGLFLADDEGDTLTVLEGRILFSNRITSRSVEVLAGYTGTSRRDGTLETHASTPEERRHAQQLISGAGQQKQLELDLRDGQGNTRKLRIEMKE